MKIGFSYPKKFKIGAFLISWWTKRPYSHVYIEIPIRSLSRDTVYHAAHGSVHFRAKEKFLRENNTVVEYELDVDRELRLKVLDKCIELAGEDYGYIELAKIFLMDICHYFKCKFIDVNGDGKGYICSELIGDLLLTLGYEIKKPLHLLKPNDIEEILQNGKTKA